MYKKNAVNVTVITAGGNREVRETRAKVKLGQIHHAGTRILLTAPV